MAFAIEVHLAHDAAPEFLDQAYRIIECNGRDVLFNQVGKTHKNVNVGFDNLDNARSTNFENNFFTAPKFTTMNLGDAGCGDRLLGEFGKEFIGRVAQLTLNLSLDFFNRDFRHLVL